VKIIQEVFSRKLKKGNYPEISPNANRTSKIYVQSGAPVVHACNPSNSGGRYQEDLRSKPARGNISPEPTLKIFNTKKADGMAQVIECLLSKCEAMSSNSSTTKKK
jgi:hypothetical protein